MNIIDYIDQYMEDRLSEADKLKFEALLAKDPEAQELVKNYSSVKSLSEDILEQELLAQVKKKVYATPEAQATPVAADTKKTNGWFWKIAIFVIGCLIGFFILKSLQGKKELSPEEQEVLMAYYQRPIYEDKVRSTDVTSLDLLSQGKYYFELNDFVKSEKTLKSNLETAPDDLQARETKYWLGHALFMQEKYEAAGEVFKESGLKNYQCLYGLSQVLSSKLDSAELSKVCIKIN